MHDKYYSNITNKRTDAGKRKKKLLLVLLYGHLERALQVIQAMSEEEIRTSKSYKPYMAHQLSLIRE